MLDKTSPLARSFAGWTCASANATRRLDVIDLTVADPDIPTPDAVVQRAIAALRAGDSRYTDVCGRAHVREAIAERHARRSGRRASAENVLLAPGAQGALFLAARCLAGPGDHFLAIEPYYLNYPPTLAASGAAVDFVRTEAEADFRVTEAAVLAALKTNTKAIVFSNPNNPTGQLLSPAEIAMLANIARRHDLWLVCDEVYGELCDTAEFTSFAACDGVDDRLVTLGSLSKSHAMTGWRFGWMAAPAKFVESVATLADVAFHGVPGFIQEAAVVALADEGAAAREAAALYRQRGEMFSKRLAGSPIEARLSQGVPFVFCDVGATGLSGAEFVELAAAEAGVRLVDGGRYGQSTAGFVRAALTSSEGVLVEAAKRLAEFAKQVEPRRPSRTQATATREGAAESSEIADGVYVSPSGAVHVWRDGNLEGIF